MTDAQIALMRLCVNADRTYRSYLARGEMAGNDERGVELFGHMNRTAQILQDAGLIEVVDMGYINARAFLGAYRPVDEESSS